MAWTTWDRWNGIELEDNLKGSPEFVVEIVSPSNSAEELHEKKQLSLATGCIDFWVVYPKQHQVEVTTLTGARIYGDGETIECTAFPGVRVAVDEVFV